MLRLMDLTKYRHTDSIDIAASPEAVYALVADITRMGEFSPVCKSRAVARRRPHHLQRRQRAARDAVVDHMPVDTAEPGKEFTLHQSRHGRFA